MIALHLNCGIVSFYTDKNQIIQWKCIYKTFSVPCEKSNTVSLASSISKNIVVFPALSEFAVKLICWIALRSASRTCYLLKFIVIIL